MRFLLDESAEHRIAAYLRTRGHDVTTVARDYPGAIADTEVLAIAVAEDRIIITNDSDFGELVVRGRRAHRGVILLRLAGDINVKTSAIERVIETHTHELHEFIVVTRRGSRVRRSRPDRDQSP